MEQVSSSKKTVYFAVPLLDVPLIDDADQEQLPIQLKEPLLTKQHDGSRKVGEECTVWKSAKTWLYLLAGVIVGVTFYGIGLYILVNYYNIASMGRSNVVMFSFLWANMTFIAFYLLFSVFEFRFALGVFIGFCTASTLTDISFGMPWKGSLIIASVLVYFAARAVNGHTERERRGTVLPMVLV